MQQPTVLEIQAARTKGACSNTTASRQTIAANLRFRGSVLFCLPNGIPISLYLYYANCISIPAIPLGQNGLQRAWVWTQVAKVCQSAVLPMGMRNCWTRMRKMPDQKVARWILRVDHRS